MQWKSSPQRYGAVPIAIHWISALAIVVMLASGLAAANTVDEETKLAVLRVHVSVGICVLFLTVMRIAWWLAVDRRPEGASGLLAWQAMLSQIVHYGLYGVILVMLSSGIALALLSGALPILIGAIPARVPEFTEYPPLVVHGIGGRVMIGLLFLHIGAALYHQFWKRDRLLARMGVGSAI